MNSTRSFAVNRGLETAIALAKRLQDEYRAEIESIETDSDETVIRLRIPAADSDRLQPRRLELWEAFVEQDLETRRGSEAGRDHHALDPRYA